MKRAISLAFDIPYTQVTKDLNRVLKNYIQETRQYDAQWNQTSVWSRLVKEYGGGPRVAVEDHPTEDEFADANDGTYIVLSGHFSQNGTRSQGHACCIIDHVIYDSWNSKQHRVYGYFKISDSGQHKKETGIQDQLDELGGIALNQMEDLVYKYINKYNIPGVPDITPTVYKKGFAFECEGRLKFPKDAEESKYLSSYDLSFPVILTPTTSYEEAEEIIKKTVYQKVYDRFYAIRKDIESKKEAYELQLAAGDSYAQNHPGYVWMDGREQRFIKSMPAWVASFLQYINMQYPGQYSDSVEVWITPLPGDPKGGKRVKFEAYDAPMMRDMLNRYKQSYERPYDDYDPIEEYY